MAENSSARQLETILLVDDDEDLRMIARLSLETLGGYRVEECPRGSEGAARAAEVQPDLVLLDQFMPDKDGAAVLEELRSNSETSDIPVVFLTGVADWKAPGSLGTIAKPFDPMTLPDDVAAFWDLHVQRTAT